MFKSGQKVLCVDGKSENSQLADHFYPVKGAIYTVEFLDTDSSSQYISLVEDPHNKASWDLERFVEIGEVTAGLNSSVSIDDAKLPNALGGVKFDKGKLRYTLLLQDLPRAVKEVTEVLEFGAQKYARMNFEKIESHRYDEAMVRHLMAYLAGEVNDSESGKQHLSHLVCCALFLIEREVKTNEKTSS